MKTFTVLSLVLLFSFTLNSTTYTSTASGDWSTMTWFPAGTPGSTDDVVIGAGHIVNVDDASAVCNNLSFGAATSKLNMSTSSSVLSIYGNFTNFSTTHVAFSAWMAGAKVKFTGSSATQTIFGLNTSTTAAQTCFMELQVDKSAGKVTTTGTDVKLNIGSSLDVISGTFELASTDDIQGRLLDGTSATSPNIMVQTNGIFTIAAGASHIRRANNTGEETKKIGTMTIYGIAEVTTTSTNYLNFSGIDIESGGLLRILLGWSTTGKINPGTITVKSGGILENTTTTDVWYVNSTTSTTVNVNTGGTFNTRSSTTPLPPVLTNNGTFRYSRSVLDGSQTIVDMDYYRLEISFEGDGTGTKTWALRANRTIADSLEINNSAKFKFEAASTQTLNLNGTLRLTSGSLDISDPDVSFVLANGITISRATGTISNTPVFGSTVNLRYTSSVANVYSGQEMPASSTVLNNLEVSGSQGMTLGADATVNGTLLLTNGLLTLGSYNLTLAGSAAIGGTPSSSNMVIADGSGELRKEFNSIGSFMFPVGDNTGTVEYSPVTLDFTNGTFGSGAYAGVKLTNASHPNFLGTPVDYLTRFWTVNQSGISSFSCDVKLNYVDADVVGATESNIALWKYDGGWSNPMLPSTDITLNEMTGTVSSFSDFTGSDNGALPIELSTFAVSVTKNTVLLIWTTTSEINSSMFEVQRKSESSAWKKVGEVIAAGNSNSPKEYSYTDRNLSSANYQYRLKMIDADGSYKYSSIVEAEIQLPKEYAISQNYPNPFNPSTKIDYQLPFDSKVTLELYGITGEKIITLVSGDQSAGYYSTEINAGTLNLSSGAYIYRMIANNQDNTMQTFTQVKKLLLTK